MRDFGRITSEVIQHLAAVEGVHLEVRLEITAVANHGLDEAKVRIVSENAQTLKFEQMGVRSRITHLETGKLRCPRPSYRG